MAKLITNRDEFLSAAISHFRQLKAYIKRRLRVAYLTFEIHEGPYTSDDILEELIVTAYERFDEKPMDLSLRGWLYWLANDILEEHFHEREREERRWTRLEDQRSKKHMRLRKQIAAKIGGEPWLFETIDDHDYHANDFAPPQYAGSAGESADRKEEVVRIAKALSRVPLKERITFEHFALEGFSQDEVGQLLAVDSREVPRTVEWVKARVFQELYQKLYAGQEARR